MAAKKPKGWRAFDDAATAVLLIAGLRSRWRLTLETTIAREGGTR